MIMKLDDAGKNLIKEFEGLRLFAYQDSAGVWTIGYGATYYHGGKPVKKGDMLLSKTAADQLFDNTVAPFEAAVNKLVKIPLTQPQYNSVVSFTYNEGIGALATSHLLIRLNEKDYQGAADEFLKWDKITDPNTKQKVISANLLSRRKIERKPFLTNTISK
jgi:lysozyme